MRVFAHCERASCPFRSKTFRSKREAVRIRKVARIREAVREKVREAASITDHGADGD